MLGVMFVSLTFWQEPRATPAACPRAVGEVVRCPIESSTRLAHAPPLLGIILHKATVADDASVSAVGQAAIPGGGGVTEPQTLKPVAAVAVPHNILVDFDPLNPVDMTEFVVPPPGQSVRYFVISTIVQEMVEGRLGACRFYCTSIMPFYGRRLSLSCWALAGGSYACQWDRSKNSWTMYKDSTVTRNVPKLAAVNVK